MKEYGTTGAEWNKRLGSKTKLKEKNVVIVSLQYKTWFCPLSKPHSGSEPTCLSTAV